MLYSRTAKYGIKALAYLAKTESKGYQTVDIVANSTDIPTEFLGKIFQSLAREKLLESQRGRGGGFRLSKAGDEVSLYEVITLIDGEDVFNRCMFDVKSCGENGTCPMHDEWEPIRDQVEDLLKQRTVADLSLDQAKSITPP